MALAQLGGTARVEELLRWTSRRRLRTAVANGDVLRVRRGYYAVSGLRAEVALRVGGVLAGPSAAQHHGFSLKRPPTRPVVLLPRGTRRPRGDLEVRWGELPAHREGVTSPVRTVIDCARWLPFDEALVVVDSALRRGVRPQELRAGAAQAPRNGRARAERVVAAGDPGAASALESLVRAHASRVAGLALETQVQIGVNRVDLADRRLRIVAECDSFGFHGGRGEFARDVRRYTELVRDGWTVVRFSWEEAMWEPTWISGVLADLVEARRATPGRLRRRGTA